MAIASPPPLSLTRLTALETARRTYRKLVSRALLQVPARESYIVKVWTEWDARLADLQRFTGTTIPDSVQRTFDRLSTQAEGISDDDMLIEWVDLYPDAVADLFPPSAATFKQADRFIAEPMNSKAVTAA